MCGVVIMLAFGISRDHKEKYLEKYSEDDFRDKIVRPLFLRMGYEDGRDLCGPEEHGRDALFCENHKLGGRRYVGLQTKKGNLSLAGTTRKNLIDAVTQVRTALETTYAVLIPTKQKIKPDEVILCCSGRINNSARNHIVEEESSTRIKFLDRDDLINLIDEHFPELWIDIETDVQPYLAELKRLASQDYDHALSRSILRQPIPFQCLSDSGFVELRLAAPKIKTQRRRGEVIRTTEFEEILASDLLSTDENHLLILGDPGSGKSTLLLRLAYLAAQQSAIADKKYQIPIVIRASSIDMDTVDAFIDYLVEATKTLSQSQSSAFNSEDLCEGRVSVFIDALDEVGSSTQRQIAANLIEKLIERYPSLRIIITARPYLSLSKLGAVSSFKRFRISPISFKQGEKMLKAHLSGQEVDQDQVNEILRKVEEVHGFELNPLLVAIFSATARYGQSDLPANVTELFKKFTELMLGRWDQEKGLEQQINTPIKDFLLRQIAYRMHLDRRAEVSIEEFRSIAESELYSRGHSASSDDLLNEIIDRSGLFRLKGDVLEFRHHMLQEFFAGRGIPSLDGIKGIVHDDWWRRPVIFFFGDNPERVGDLFEVVTSAHNIDSLKNFDIAITAGLALQACYLGNADEKLDLWKWVAVSLGLGINDFVADLDEYEDYPILSFLVAYLTARDAVALSLIKERKQQLLNWARAPESLKVDSESDQKVFWLATAFLEVGDLKTFLELLPDVKRLVPEEQFALFSACGLIERVRAVDPATKKLARQAQQELFESVQLIGHNVATELGSQLLEYRRGKLVAIEESE